MAVDAGLRTGLALFGADGRLIWCRSHNLGRAARLRRAAANILREYQPALLVIEGGGKLAEIWCDEAGRRSIPVRLIQAEQWRSVLLAPRQRASGKIAKKVALDAARRVVEWSGARRPTSLRHDAAEAVLAGLYVLLKEKRLTHNPLA